MKKILNILAIISLLTAVSETIQGRTEETILFTIWSFYLKYLADKSE